MAQGREEGEIWTKWFDYLKDIKKNIQEASCNILKTKDLKVFLCRKNRHILKTEGLYFWRYIALEKEDVTPVGTLSDENLINIFTSDIFGEDFISPKFKPTDFMLLVKLEDYFKDIIADKSKKYINFAHLFNNNNNIIKHYCSKCEALKHMDKIINCLNKVGLQEQEYIAAIKYLERKALLNGYEEGISIMFPITVGAYYIMAIFLSFKNNFMEVTKFGNFFEAKFKEEYRPLLLELHSYLNQLPMLILTKLYSLFFTYEPTIDFKQLIKKGLSVVLAIPEQSIVESNNGNSEDFIEIKLSEGSNITNLWVPYPCNFDKKERKSITTILVNEISTKLSELYQSIISEQKKLRIKDAVVAIMGRNMSHNIGSHVLWHLAQTVNADKSFYDYLRERMGFVGLISTTSPSWSLEYDISKIIDAFKKQVSLLHNLVKSEKENLAIEIDCNEGSCKRNIELPHGSYGAHAFYTILENIIRNTVKHNIKQVKQTVKFTLTIEDSLKFKDYIEVKITDNLEKYSLNLETLIANLNRKKDEKIIDNNGKLINRNLGFKEIRICAAFLRLIPQEAIDDRFEPPLLEVKNNGKLTYVITSVQNNF